MAPGPSFDALAASEPVARVLELARAADVTLVSVGIVGEASLLRVEGLVDGPAMAHLVAAGAVGEILGRWYDATGREVEAPGLAAVGLSLADLRSSRRVVAVAGGTEKAAALRAALAGGIVDEVVIDDGLAEALLADVTEAVSPAVPRAPSVAPKGATP